MSLHPPRSAFGTVDPAPASVVTDPAALRDRILDIEVPLFERFEALFGLRNLNTDESTLALGEAMLRDRSALLRHECAYVLGQMQRPVAVPHLSKALRHDPNAMVRHEAAEALGAIGTGDVLPLLEEALEDDPALEVRESCEIALAHIGYLRERHRF